MKQVFIIIIIFFLFGKHWTQDPIFFNNQQNRVFLNPAHSGLVESFSLGLNYRNQWPELAGNYKTFTAEVNQYLGKGNGLSFTFMNDNAANTLNKNEYALGYGHLFTFKEKHNLSIGVQVAYFQKYLNFNNLTFGNMIDPRRGFVYSLDSANQINDRVSNIDLNFGLLYYNKIFFGGLTLKHLNSPDESILTPTNIKSNLPILVSGQLGGKIKIKEYLQIIPTLVYYEQSTFRALNLLVTTRFREVQLDIGYSDGNGMIIGAGANFDKISFGYYYQKTDRLNTWSMVSTHEVRVLFKTESFNKENNHYFDF
jgi:type IX secretion system PorP/SprF family membrane protein